MSTARLPSSTNSTGDPLFLNGLGYFDFLQQHATDPQRVKWEAVYQAIQLQPDQVDRLNRFQRQMQVRVLAGAWCGDCVEQCPIFQRFAEITPQIQLTFFDRDAHSELATRYTLCGGRRVPTVLFFCEDGYFCGLLGDRTLAKYQQMERNLTGAACPTGLGVDHDLLRTATQQWLDEFERVQLMLRFSPRLREKHGD